MPTKPPFLNNIGVAISFGAYTCESQNAMTLTMDHEIRFTEPQLDAYTQEVAAQAGTGCECANCANGMGECQTAGALAAPEPAQPAAISDALRWSGVKESHGTLSFSSKAWGTFVRLIAPTPAQPAEQERDAIAELNHAQWLALENVRYLAARHRKEEWAQHMLRFVAEAGTNKAQITRQQVEAAQPVSEPAVTDAGVETALRDLHELWDFAASMKCHSSMMRRWSKALSAIESLAAASRSAKQAQELAQPTDTKPMAWVLLRNDEDGLQPIMFFGGADKPKDDYKDKFELRPVWLTPQQPAQADTLDVRAERLRQALLTVWRTGVDDVDSHCKQPALAFFGCKHFHELENLTTATPRQVDAKDAIDAVMELFANYRAVNSKSPIAEQDAYRKVLAVVTSFFNSIAAKDKP